jgi:cytochrome b subunit of formate dehydrogenase
VKCHLARVVFGMLCMTLLFSFGAFAQEDEDCFMCHGEADAEQETPDGKTRSIFVDEAVYSTSVHADNGCISCHMDIEEVPHDTPLEPVDCGMCHDEDEMYNKSVHGVAVANGDPLAPHCWNCHSKHNIKPPSNPESTVNNINIPATCGSCHAEDAVVAKERNIPQHDILANYEQSIHGEGVLRKGLTVTAVCTSCHSAHNVLPHTDPDSTINRDNVVGTCTQCHALIEQVHRKWIDGQLWEEEPNKIPVCVECHQPHKARKVFYEQGASDRDCLSCHKEEVQGEERAFPAVDMEVMVGSTHEDTRCAQCHTGARPDLARPCATVAESVDCSICHNEVVEAHARGIHGKLVTENDPDAPDCLDCHAGHGTPSKDDPASPTFPRNVPTLCGKCHQHGAKASRRTSESGQDAVENYTMSIHGKGLLESGLTVTATCVNCHSAHTPLRKDDPESSVYPDNIPETCGECHHGIQEAFEHSIHSPLVNDTDKALPVCSGCHSAHSISRSDSTEFRLDVMRTCGNCHEEVAETYFETYHGKSSNLGSEETAKCHNCHGAHNVLPIENPASTLHRDNIVETCGECHEGSHRRFAGYLTHATHHDPDKYPILFIAFWSMTLLLVGTFAFFGLHTLAWLPHSFRELKKMKGEEDSDEDKRLFLRFDPIVRQLHFVLILSFFGLAITGMALKFSYMPWALWVSNNLGGLETMGAIHRFCAVVMTILFTTHLGVIVHRKRKSGKSWFKMLTDDDSLVPNLRDGVEMFQTIRWFLHLGPQPQYGRWTYWEKFDYMAVFWGIAIIGSTGIVLWFPEFCTLFMPGWFINVATIIHSDEALLAVGFIFTIHFFNTHFRPEKFPMDKAMFTGRISVAELKRERPRQYEALLQSGDLEKRIVSKEPREFRFWAVVFGNIALIVGFSLVFFILWSMIFGYK